MTTTEGFVEIDAEDAARHGLAAVRIRVDARAAGMSSRTFPGNDLYLKLNGPPGAPLLVKICSCTSATRPLTGIVTVFWLPVGLKP